MERASHPQWTDRVHSISSTVDCSRPQWTDRVQGPQDAKEQLPERRRGAARRCLLTPVVSGGWLLFSTYAFPSHSSTQVSYHGAALASFGRICVYVSTAGLSVVVQRQVDHDA